MSQGLHYPNRVLLGALGLGICADLLFYGQWLGISVALFVAVSLAVLAGLGTGEARRPTRANLWLGAVALFFAVCLAVREAPLLVALNLIAVGGALILLLAYYQGGALTRLPIMNVLKQTFYALGAGSVLPAGMVVQGVRSIPLDSGQVRRLAPVGRGLLLAVPVLGCFGTLLMGADNVFASYILDLFRLRLPFNVGTAIVHMLLILAVGYVAAGGFQVALQESARAIASDNTWGELPAEGDTQPLVLPRSLQVLGCTEALTVLLSVDLLFGGFMLVQGAYFFGGMNTLDRTGMTYADYARRGFFELLAVTGLALGLLWCLALITRRPQRWQGRAFNGASVALIVLMLGMLVSAFQRMLLYEQAYGFTRLRLYTHSFMIWLAVVLLVFLIALLRNRLQFFVSGTIATGLIYLAVLNIANPDAMIVRENIARYQTSGKLDTDYLSGLSADAIPALVDSLDSLDSETRSLITSRLNWELAMLEEAARKQGWPSWHVARAQAREQLQQAVLIGSIK